MERHLSAILAADMVGYSRLMEADEIGTIERQKAHRNELINPAFEKFHGRIVKEMGDGVLVEFPSVVDAVHCATEIQRAMPVREVDVPEEQRIQYRVGINLGDIVVESGDVFGDGVNIAARLEQLADPGGICISGTTFDHLKKQVEVGYESLGEVTVKNIERPIRMYRVLLDRKHAGKVLRNRNLTVSLEDRFELPAISSIAVLPFGNLSGDMTHDHLGDSLAENIIAELTTSPDLIVIACNSVSSYKGHSPDAGEVANHLNVRYVLDGSFQTFGDRMRVVAKLLDTEKDTSVWAERYDYEISDIFAIQDDLTRKVAEELEVKLTRGSIARQWRKDFSDPKNHRLYVQGRSGWAQYSPEGHQAAEAFWTELYERDPHSVSTNLAMARLHCQKLTHGLGLTRRLEEHLRIAEEFVNKASLLAGDNANAELLMTHAFLAYQRQEHSQAIAYVDRAQSLAPSSAEMLLIGGGIKLQCGKPIDGIKSIRLGMRAEPNYSPLFAVGLSEGYLIQGRFSESIRVSKGILASGIPGYHVMHALGHLAVASILSGDKMSGKKYAQKLLKLQPNTSIVAAAFIKRNDKDRKYVDRFLDALEEAGIPKKPVNSR